MLSSSMSVCLKTLPLGITTLPVLSLSSPLKMSNLPATIDALTASAALRAASGTIEP